MLSFIRRNLIECAVGLFVIAIVATVLTPTGCGSRESARRISCSSNLRQIGQGLMQYAQEYDEKLPRLSNGKTKDGKDFTWRLAAHSYIRDVNVWKCPSNNASKLESPIDGLPIGFETTDVGPIRRYAFALGRIPAPSQTIMAFEENAIDESAKNTGVSWNKDDGSDASLNVLYAGHLGTGNYLFADGHVQSMKPLKTIANNVNMWHVDTKTKVSPRAMQKLKAATKKFE